MLILNDLKQYIIVIIIQLSQLGC